MFNEYIKSADMKRLISRVALLLFILVVLYFTVFGGVKLTADIPEQFAGYSGNYLEKNKKMVYLDDNHKPVYPITHDDNALYILNGAEDDFKSYRIDRENKEIVIEKNLVKFMIKRGTYYQLMTISNRNYSHIMNGSKIKIRLNYLYLDNQSTLLEYDLSNKTTREISSTYVSP